ncbi:MAG TPA: cyclopropane-fatty-acyl-phospholipid synthase family protein [Anaerolineae bacterium]
MVLAEQTSVTDGAAGKAMTMRLLPELFGDTSERVGVRLWDGTPWPDARPRPATLVLHGPAALRSMFLPGTELALAEAYLYDDFDVEGEIEAVFDLAETLSQATAGWRKKLRAGRDLLRLPAGEDHSHGPRGPARLSGRLHSEERDGQAVRYHYDVSNDFYALWLDPHLVYSCAYFARPDEELAPAQERKLDYICRKLRLRPGTRLLDLGCGWGGLILHAARHYGVEATGITLSRPQAELANARIQAGGLAGRCRALVQDYRQTTGEYDALVSVGMFEHVGAAMLPLYFRQAWDLLRPGGVFLNHGIASRATDRPPHGPGFSDTYVFPDGELVPINISLHAAEGCGFEVRDVESLRDHYVLTLRHWVRRLEAAHAEALRFVDEPTYRVWRLYMAGSADGFRRGRLNVYQSLLLKPGPGSASGLPLTREDWY